MRKIIFLMLLLLWGLLAFSQKEDTYHDTIIETTYPCIQDTILIGYISTHTNESIDVEKDNQEFAEVVLFIYSLGIDIVDVCMEDGLILMVLNEKWKDKYALVDEINKTYTGTCYFKINNNSFYHSSCEDRIKKQIKERK